MIRAAGEGFRALALAPHSRMAKDTELPVLYRDVQKMVAGRVPTPHLDELLAAR